MAECLDLAVEKLLKSNKSPKRKVGELDNRGSHFYLALYWANELAKKDLNPKSKSNFKMLSETLEKNEKLIISEIDESQGFFKEIDGYYMPCEIAISKAMRPSKIFNEIIDNF